MSRASLVLIATILLVACRTLPAPSEPDSNVAATLAWIEETKPPTVGYVRYTPPLRYEIHNVRFVTMQDGGDYYLLEFDRDCSSLERGEIVSDAVKDAGFGNLRAGVTRISNCLVTTIYRILPAIDGAPDSAQ